jgi:hypothetical protein
MAVDGPLPLRDSAEEAAKAVFNPTAQGGITVKITGVLTYTFVP